MKFATPLLAFILALSLAAPARADDLLVLSAAALRKAFEKTPAQFLKATGSHVRFVFGTAGEMRDKALSGPFDVVVVPPAPLAALVKKGVVVRGSRRDLGLVRLAAAVRSGAKAPNISSVSAFEATLLAAPSIGLADPAAGATTGIYLAKLLKKLGLADRLKSKIRLFPDGQAAMEAVAQGKIAIGIGQKSEIVPVKGVDVVGYLPNAVQLKTIYSAGLATKSAKNPLARRLLAFLSGPQTRSAIEASGFDPAP